MRLRTPSQYRKAVTQWHRREGVRSRAATTRRHTLLAAVHDFELRRHAAPAERKGKPAPFALRDDYSAPRRGARRRQTAH